MPDIAQLERKVLQWRLRKGCGISCSRSKRDAGRGRTSRQSRVEDPGAATRPAMTFINPEHHLLWRRLLGVPFGHSVVPAPVSRARARDSEPRFNSFEVDGPWQAPPAFEGRAERHCGDLSPISRHVLRCTSCKPLPRKAFQTSRYRSRCGTSRTRSPRCLLFSTFWTWRMMKIALGRGGCAGLKLQARLSETGPDRLLNVVRKSKDVKGFDLGCRL